MRSNSLIVSSSCPPQSPIASGAPGVSAEVIERIASSKRAFGMCSSVLIVQPASNRRLPNGRSNSDAWTTETPREATYVACANDRSTPT
jgi:hypothetical protein